jgi:transposase
METKTKRLHRKYDAGFKQEALNMLRSGSSVGSVSAKLGVGENLLYKWRQESVAGATVDEVSVHQEVDLLRKQVRQLEQERDILKKALLIFSQKT